MKPSSNVAVKSLTGLLASAALLLPTLARASVSEGATPSPASQSTWTPNSNKPTTHRALKLSTKARERYRAAWGVDAMRVTRVASGSLIRFNYRVTDPAQAAALVDKRATPVLYAQRAHAMLSVPVMDKVGPLRQTGELKAGQEYWVTFSNKGNLVKPGDRVDVIIGPFHADGLLVQ